MTVKESGAHTLAEQIEIAERLLEERQVSAAAEAFDRAEEMGADRDGCSAGRWMASMLGGDFEGAWRESDAIRRRGGPDPNRFWMGEDIRGKRVIVRCLHGFGDAIQFLRFLPRLHALAASVVVEVPPRLLVLAPFLDGVAEVITWGDGAPSEPPAWEVQLEVMELPYLLRVTEADLPAAERYLRVPPGLVLKAAERMGPRRGLRVGVVWAAGEWNPERSMPVSLLEPLFQSGAAEFWSLQGGAAEKEIREAVSAGLVRDASICGDGIPALAAVIANLDVVITVDTLAAHLAGAMGVPVWVLLQHAADWRWMTDRGDSPWYPSMRLFRQERQGDWSGLMKAVEAELFSVGGSSLGNEA